MAESLMSILEKLDDRIRFLSAENAKLRKLNSLLSGENEDLRRQAEETGRERDKALLDADYLSVSHKLADSPESLVSARRHISRLIRNIDRCLDMLKE